MQLARKSTADKANSAGRRNTLWLLKWEEELGSLIHGYSASEDALKIQRLVLMITVCHERDTLSTIQSGFTAISYNEQSNAKYTEDYCMEDVYHLGIKALIRGEDGKFLLLKVNPAKLKGKNTTYWDLPGGRVQKGDTVTSTLEREVEEETGIASITNIEQVGMVLSNIRIPVDDDSVGLILGVFACSIPDDSQISISDEHTDFGWFTATETASMLAVKYPREFCATIAKL